MDIPEDIQRKVGEVLGRPGERMGVDQYRGLSLRVGLALAEERARATAAERERCAKVAAAIGKEYADPFFSPHIANAIRNPP